ncbi:hypothetical protein C497_01760 [Halalkalicoccus jeotgali B3]|uniref:DUF7351 domain-containing protein n=1 Tax=Halalkalicoccus jeotgali (strain DSM 18796 / CECT 7217 / JCM 14584 / KCTC 4019 / B3) TaxID=795797 RepID=D8JB06_HALJB|nr:hypothetical protein HacjB3_15496 [Halalkalicoccus jeotgali B3]ELY41446.1 hypothetical protein C497_01760 [Halalkalicoccus jeotgali B3]
MFAGYDREKIPEIVSQYLRTISQHAINGFCPYCNGRMESTVRAYDARDVDPVSAADRSEDADDRFHDHPEVQFDCQRCIIEATLAVDHALLLAEPAVTNFYYENGILLQDCLIWEFSELNLDNVEIEHRKPIRVAVTFRIDESALTVVVNETFDVKVTDEI